MTKSEDTKEIIYYLSLPYTIILRPDEEGDFVARIEELPGCIAHGENTSEALENLREAQQLWIEDCLESGEPVPEPQPEEKLPSGKWVQRVPRTLHKRLVQLAKKEEVSLNQLVTSMLSEAATAKTWKDHFKVWFSESRGAMRLSYLDPWLAALHPTKDAIWIYEKSKSFRTGLLPTLDITHRLISAHDESTDEYNPKTAHTHKKELARR